MPLTGNVLSPSIHPDLCIKMELSERSLRYMDNVKVSEIIVLNKCRDMNIEYSIKIQLSTV